MAEVLTLCTENESVGDIEGDPEDDEVAEGGAEL